MTDKRTFDLTNQATLDVNSYFVMDQSSWDTARRVQGSVLDALFVEVAGDTMTGALTVNVNNANALLIEQNGVNDDVLQVDTGTPRITLTGEVDQDHIFTDVTVGNQGYDQALTINAGAVAVTASQRGLNFLVNLNGSAGGASDATGFVGDVRGNQTAGTISVLQAGSCNARITNAGDVSTLIGLTAGCIVSGAGDATNIRVLEARDATFSSTGGSNNVYGLYIGNQGHANVGVAYGVFIEPISGAGTNIALRARAGEVRFNDDGGDHNFWVESLNDTVALTVDGGLDAVGIGIALGSHAAKLHVDQPSASGAKPVLLLDQADVDEVLMKITATAQAASADRTLVADSDFGTPGALVGWIQVEIQDDGNRVADSDYYIPFYAAPT